MNWQTASLITFLAASTFLVYVLFGYPLLLAMLSRFAAQPVGRAPVELTVSVILPVRNGAEWMDAKLRSLLALDYPRRLMQILVVSDGSDDGTDGIVESFAADGVELVRLPQAGKANAINAGLRRARGEILLFTDVRQALAPDSLSRLVACFADPRVGVASGELVILDGETMEEANVGLYWRYEKWIRKGLSRIDSVLGATGAIYAMRRQLSRPLPPNTLLDDVYLPLAAFFAGYRVVLEESAKAYDMPTTLSSEFARKVRTLAGVYQVIRLYPALLGPANRMWIHFVSHKLGRLLLPYCLLAIAAASFQLPGVIAPVVLAGQAAFYALALTDVWMPDGMPLKRLTSPARTFAVLMAAAFCATWVFLRPSNNIWKQTRVRHRPGFPKPVH